MKTISSLPFALLILGLIIGCRSLKEESVKESLPKDIQSIVSGGGFFDGGSIIIELEDARSVKWQLYYHKAFVDMEKKDYQSITITKITEFNEPVIHQEGRKLKKGSDDEENLLFMIFEYAMNNRFENEEAEDWTIALLEEKGIVQPGGLGNRDKRNF